MRRGDYHGDLQEAPEGNAAVGTPKDKAAKRKEIKAPKAAGLTSESDRDTEATENAAASDPTADLSTID